MRINNKLAQYQQQKIQHYAKNNDAYSFFNLLTSPELLATVDALIPEHRERQFPPTETLSMFLAQALNQDRSCQKAVNDSAIKRLMGGLPLISTATGGYCRARQRLPLTMISTLARQTGRLIQGQTPDQWHWQGKRVYVIDGTTLTMPDTEANQAAYPQQRGQQPGLGFPICRLLGVTCLSSGAIVNASMGPFRGKGSDEQALLRNILDTFTTGDCVLGDAFFGTYFLLNALHDKGVDALFEQMGARKRVTDYRRGKRLGAKDHLITLTKPKKKPDWMTLAYFNSVPDRLIIRELHVGGKTLITTWLNPKEAPKSSLKSLYKKRWQIEVDFRHLKTTLGMDTLSCKTPEMIQKEVWVYFLAYNLIRLLMAQSALLADVLAHQLSFKHCLQLWLAWRQQKVSDTDASKTLLFSLMAQRRVGHRPGRRSRLIQQPRQCRPGRSRTCLCLVVAARPWNDVALALS